MFRVRLRALAVVVAIFIAMRLSTMKGVVRQRAFAILFPGPE